MTNNLSPALVLIIADSLALPRQGLPFKHTWPAILSGALKDVTWINRGVRESTTERLNTEGEQGKDCLEWYEPDLVILQLGICDCAPRVMKRSVARLFHRLPFNLGFRFSTLLEKIRGRKVENCYVPISDSEFNIRRYIDRATSIGTQVIVISILPVSQFLFAKNPRIKEQIEKYNAMLNRLSDEFPCLSVIQPFEGLSTIDDLFIDGYHVNQKGSHYIAAKLQPLVCRILTSRQLT